MKRSQVTSKVSRVILLTTLFAFTSFAYAKEYRLVEVISDFFPRSEKLYLTLELDGSGQITHLKKQEYFDGVITGEDIFSVDEIKNPKSSYGVLIYSKEGRDVIWLKTNSSTIEKNGGTVKITYLHNAIALMAKKRRKSQSYRLQRDKLGEWKLTPLKSSQKINVMDFKKNETMVGAVGVSKIKVVR